MSVGGQRRILRLLYRQFDSLNHKRKEKEKHFWNNKWVSTEALINSYIIIKWHIGLLVSWNKWVNKLNLLIFSSISLLL